MKYFTADPHFGHGSIVRMMARVRSYGRLFNSSEEHDEFLLDRINSTVGRNDELIINGDFAWDNPHKYKQKIRCRHVRLILGNHDKKEKSYKAFGDVREVFRTRAYSQCGNDYIKLYICHYPTMYWDGSHRGWGHLYGHTHAQREDYLDMLEPQRRAMDVGVDNAYRLLGDYRPFSETEIYSILGSRSGHDDIRFYNDYQCELYQKHGVNR